MIVHIVDGTFELFRQYFARPSHINSEGKEVAATRAVLSGLLNMILDNATHIGVATDHVVESFRNELYEGYKTGEGIEPGIASQFEILEEGIELLGVKLCAMISHEADDGMASMAQVALADPNVEKTLLYTPDKDLAQCVVSGKVLQVDRRNNRTYDVQDVIEKHGVPPESIPDLLALKGDTADGFPGLKGWGAKSAATVLARYGTIENIPLAAGQWDITVRSAPKLVEMLKNNFDDAMLFKKLAILDAAVPTIDNVSELKWQGPKPEFYEFTKSIDAAELSIKANKLAKNLT